MYYYKITALVLLATWNWQISTGMCLAGQIGRWHYKDKPFGTECYVCITCNVMLRMLNVTFLHLLSTATI